jgi:hypothetical protein
MGIAMNFPA